MPRLLRPDLLVIGVALLSVEVLGLLGELLIQGLPLPDKTRISLGMEITLPPVESLLAGDQDLLELLQASPLRLLLRSGARKLALPQRELPLRVYSGLEARLRLHLLYCHGLQGRRRRRVPLSFLDRRACLLGLMPRRREAPTPRLMHGAFRHKAPTLSLKLGEPRHEAPSKPVNGVVGGR